MQRLILAIIFFFVAAMPNLVTAKTQTTSERERLELFQQRYAAVKAAMTSRDAKAIASLLAPDFESVDVSGVKETADQMIQQTLALPQDVNKKSETSILSITSNNSKVIVVQRYHMTTTKTLSNSAQQRAIELVVTSTDTWLRLNSKWLLKRTVTEQFDYSIDGKLVVHKERGKLQ